eukprot:m.111661 g.111661  ORF g.111661 m.111661 type:complete len:350 (+) comp10758_c0_seq1:31-1080(+)
MTIYNATHDTKTALADGEPFPEGTTDAAEPPQLLPMTSAPAPASTPDEAGDTRVPHINGVNLRLPDVGDNRLSRVPHLPGLDGVIASSSPYDPFGDLMSLDLPPSISQSMLHQHGVSQWDLTVWGIDSDRQPFHHDGTEHLPSSPAPMSPAAPSIVSDLDTNASNTPVVVPAATPPASNGSHGNSTAHRPPRSGASARKMLKFGGQAGKSQREAKPKHKINPSPPKATEAEQVQMDAWKEQCGDELMVIPMAEWQEEMQRLYAPATPRDWELLVLLRKQANNRKYQAVHKQKKMLDYHHLQADIQALSAQCAALGVENEKIKAAKAEVVADNRKLIQMILDLKEQLCNQ